ncbi:MAG: hypothetical protein M0Z60_07040, partial [Nitrospiraceae bacterium]|nr:hypothetical protein [Nitrospiraceae bacterium]
VQFWAANTGLLGMLLFYALGIYNPSEAFRALTAAFGGLEVFSIVLFLYNMLATLLPKAGN